VLPGLPRKGEPDRPPSPQRPGISEERLEEACLISRLSSPTTRDWRSWVLHERDDASSHEPAGPHRRARARDLRHLDHAARGGHLTRLPAFVASISYFRNPTAGVHDDLEPVASHAANVPRARRDSCIRTISSTAL
jgi:hypothetical protein